MPGVVPNSIKVIGGSPEKPALTYVDSGRFGVYLDADRGSFPVAVSADKIAESVVNDYCTTLLAYSEDAGPAILAFPEVVTEKDLTSKYSKLVQEALDRQQRWYKQLVALADDDWSRHRRHATISNLQREAARSLKLEREWLFLIEDTKVDVTQIHLCPACKAPVVVGASVCQVCRCILDPKLASNYQFAK